MSLPEQSRDTYSVNPGLEMKVDQPPKEQSENAKTTLRATLANTTRRQVPVYGLDGEIQAYREVLTATATASPQKILQTPSVNPTSSVPFITQWQPSPQNAVHAVPGLLLAGAAINSSIVLTPVLLSSALGSNTTIYSPPSLLSNQSNTHPIPASDQSLEIQASHNTKQHEVDAQQLTHHVSAETQEPSRNQQHKPVIGTLTPHSHLDSSTNPPAASPLQPDPAFPVSSACTWDYWPDGDFTQVFSLTDCKVVIRPQTNTNRIPSQLVEFKARIHKFTSGVYYEHRGVHDHPKPARLLHLTPPEQDKLHDLISSNPKSGPLALLVGVPTLYGPGQSAAEVSSVLANQDRLKAERRAVKTGQSSGGDRFVAEFSQFCKEHPDLTIRPHLHVATVITIQSEFMASQLIKDTLVINPSDPVEGIVSDAAHGFWQERNHLLIVSSVYSPLLHCWVPGIIALPAPLPHPL
ncbi:hypothetical protein BC835DRAFT_1308245 [Cytidiella melzeri]|nr:hypothetical protein BC835DRAFT_1308245 [Cytidiella melzeri]